MLRQRVLTAVIGLPIVLGLLIYGTPWLLSVLFLGFVGFATYETAEMMLPRLARAFAEGEPPSPPSTLIGSRALPLLCIALSLGLFLTETRGAFAGGRDIIVAWLLVSLLLGVFSARSIERAMAHALGALVAVAYGCLPWFAIWDLVVGGPGARYVLLLLAIVWSGDTGAYFGGRFFGRHRLAPLISPKKTVEGAIAGLASSIVGAFVMNEIYSGELAPWPVILCLGVLGGAFGQLGDLVESAFKRFAGVKDSGSLIPGHGGFLDRVDGLLFAAPVIWFILNTLK